MMGTQLNTIISSHLKELDLPDTNPVNKIKHLENIIVGLLAEQGLHVEEGSLKVSSDGIFTMRVIIENSKLINPEDLDIDAYESAFQSIVEDW